MHQSFATALLYRSLRESEAAARTAPAKGAPGFSWTDLRRTFFRAAPSGSPATGTADTPAATC